MPLDLWGAKSDRAAVKKTFPFEVPPHKPERVVANMKADVRKYIKRERNKKRPEGVDFWDFDCRTGAAAESAKVLHVEEIVPAIDKAASDGWASIYIEILSKKGVRKKSSPGRPRTSFNPERRKKDPS